MYPASIFPRFFRSLLEFVFAGDGVFGFQDSGCGSEATQEEKGRNFLNLDQGFPYEFASGPPHRVSGHVPIFIKPVPEL
jgi:hypothetical protein